MVVGGRVAARGAGSMGEERGSDGQVGERKEKKRKGKWVAALGFDLG